MKKEIRKMYVKAVAKIVFAVLFGILLVIMCVREADLELAGMIICCVLWGIVILIYIASGIITIKSGTAQFKEYMRNSSYSEKQLEEEYRNAKDFGSMHVGENHVFVNASDGFYVLFIERIQKVWIRHLGENPAKGRPGYYYLYIKSQDMQDNIKAYYVNKNRVHKAMEYLLEKGEHISEGNEDS